MTKRYNPNPNIARQSYEISPEGVPRLKCRLNKYDEIFLKIKKRIKELENTISYTSSRNNYEYTGCELNKLRREEIEFLKGLINV